MPFPPTRKLLKEAGYDFLTTKVCPCGATMELWHTPKDQVLPMNPMPDDDSKAESHFATCPRAEQFRRKRPTAAAAHETSPEPAQQGKPNGHAEGMSPTPTTSNPPPQRRKPDRQGW